MMVEFLNGAEIPQGRTIEANHLVELAKIESLKFLMRGACG